MDLPFICSQYKDVLAKMPIKLAFNSGLTYPKKGKYHRVSVLFSPAWADLYDKDQSFFFTKTPANIVKYLHAEDLRWKKVTVYGCFHQTHFLICAYAQESIRQERHS